MTKAKSISMDKFVIDKNSYIVCSKFKAFDCLTFISNLIKNLPDNTENEADYTFTRQGAEFIIMNIMDTGINVKISPEMKNSYKGLIEGDYFGILLKKVFINATQEVQAKIKDDLLSLYTYNDAEIDEQTEYVLFATPQLLFSALSHALRYNYNDFFIIGER